MAVSIFFPHRPMNITKNIPLKSLLLALMIMSAFGAADAFAALPSHKAVKTGQAKVAPKKTKPATEKKRAAAVDDKEDDIVIDSIRPGDGLPYVVTADGDTVMLTVVPEERHGKLTEEDFQEVARELDVESAAIKAIVEIEAGRSHQGLWGDEEMPVINFDLNMFRKMARRNGVNLSKYRKSHPVVFARPNSARYGGHMAAQTERLKSAMTIHKLSAIQGTFWGMFQIGGFNWKKCGTESAYEFARLMSRSERDQLELFANFIRNSNLLTALRNKDWRAFAAGYNGPGYARRGYHTRMAAAYAKHVAAEKKAAKEKASTEKSTAETSAKEKHTDRKAIVKKTPIKKTSAKKGH